MSIYKNSIRLLTSYVEFEKRKALKKESNEELMLIAMHHRRWWTFRMSKHEKKTSRNKFYWLMF